MQRLGVHRLAVLLLAAATPRARGAGTTFSIYAGGPAAEAVRLANASAAIPSAYRWNARNPTWRWALAPDFCSAMFPLLVEGWTSSTWFWSSRTNFTACERVHAAVRDAFAVWQAANPELRFVDVTGRCQAERLWRPIADDRCAESDYCLMIENATTVDWKQRPTPLEQLPNPKPYLCSHRTCFECDRADVIVGGFTQKNRRLGDQHAAARVQRTSMSGMRPLAASRLDAAEGKTVLKGWIEFNVDDEYKNADGDYNQLGNKTLRNCWRIDNDICDWVVGINAYGHPKEVLNVFLISFWSLFAVLLCCCLCTCMMLLQRLAANLLTGWDVDRDGKLELQEIVYVLDEFCGEVCFECRCPQVHEKKMSPLAGCLSVLETLSQYAITIPIAIIFGLIASTLLYTNAVTPCYDCRDFEASAIHEVGHLLSLEHISDPANAITLTLLPPPPSPPPPPANETMYVPPAWPVEYDIAAPVSCREPLSSVRVSTADEYATENTTGSSAIMVPFGSTGLERPAAGKPRHCLDQSDLDALNFLYASCATMLPTPTCIYHHGFAASLKLFEEWFKLFMLPTCVLIGMKGLAFALLFLEDVIASWQVKREAKRLLKEAEAADEDGGVGGSSPQRVPKVSQVAPAPAEPSG